jgi:hypothetical protein
MVGMNDKPSPDNPTPDHLLTRVDPLLAAEVGLLAVNTGLHIVEHFKGDSPPAPPQEPPPPRVELPPGVERE